MTMKKRILGILFLMTILITYMPIMEVAAYTHIEEVNNMPHLSCGSRYTGILEKDGSLWMCGDNDDGQFGHGRSITEIATPIESSVEDVAQVSCGSSHTGILKNDGSLWMCGNNMSGRLGWGYMPFTVLDTGSYRSTPIMIMKNVAQVSCGRDHTGIVKNDGSLWMCGNNETGELGIGTNASKAAPVKVMEDVAQVSCGFDYTGIVKNDGSLWMCGGNFGGQLGDGTYEEKVVPVKVMENVAQVSCGRDHTGIVKNDGSLWMCGSNSYGQLSDGTYEKKAVPVKVMENVAQVSCGDYHTGIVKNDGSLWMCGNNSYGQLGDGTYEEKAVPVKVMENVAQVSGGDYHTGIVKNDGSLWMCGSNSYGQLGDGTYEKRCVPVKVSVRDSTAVIHADDVVIKISDVIGDTSFETYVKSSDAMSYNPELSYLLSGMARAAYKQGKLDRSLKSMGYDMTEGHGVVHDYNDDRTAAYTIAKKTLSDNSEFVLITIRGSWGWSWASNANIGAVALAGLGKHAGFEADATEIYNRLIDFAGIDSENTTYVITGHSQGAAAANLLAVKLYDNGVPSSNVYDYNFACPNVACLINSDDWNPDRNHDSILDHDNIFNIGNVEDPVSFVPSNYIHKWIPVTGIASKWGKFGQSYWFYPSSDNRSLAGHDMKYYLRALQQLEPITSFYTYWQIPQNLIKRIIGIHCPVDVIVYDTNGKPVASVINNQENYYDSEFGEVMILVDGDEKWIMLPNEKDYRVSLTATDSGEMKYEVYTADITNDTIIDEKSFEDVQLNDGKKFASDVDSDKDVADSKLFVVDGNDQILADVQVDGTETDHPNQSDNESTAVREGASAAAAEKAITSMKSDTDPEGSVFKKLRLKSTKQTKNSITLKWEKNSKAVRYVVYGNTCGKAKPKRLKTVKGNKNVTSEITKIAGKKLKKGTYYKFIVVALDKNNNVVSMSKLIHVATKGGKAGNYKSVTVKKSILTKAKKLKKGKTLKLNAKAVAQSKKLSVKKHVAMRYESTNNNIATVSKSGKVTAKKKGSCYIYAYTQNGVFKKVKVVVK